MKSHRGPNGVHGRHRGIAAMAIVFILALLLSIVGMVLGGARDLDLTVSRLETLRAMYAAEAGAEMALREVMTNADADGDGAIGAVSDDGNEANDPVIGGASVCVERTVTADGATLDVKGSTSVALRNMRITVTQGESSMVVYGANPSSTPMARVWSGGAWSAPSDTLDIDDKPRWISVAACPTRNETAFIANDSKKDINAMIHDGATWGHLIELTTDMGTKDDRPLAVAYEQLSGDALFVFRVGNSASIYYRTWNGASWSSQFSTANLSTGQLRCLRLVPKPGSDRIILLSLDDNEDIVGMVWDGSAWGGKQVLESNAQTKSEECMDVAYEALSGDAVIVWSESGQDRLRYRTHTSGGWSGEIEGPDIGAPARWVRLASDPAGDRIGLIALDDDNDVNVAIWSGAAFGLAYQVETSSSVKDRRAVAIAFEPAGTRAVALYSQDSSHAPRYRSFDGSNWSSELVGPDLGDDFAAFQMTPFGVGQEILALAVTKGHDRLKFMRWNGVSFVGATELEDNLTAKDKHEAFMIVARDSTATVVSSIVAVEP